MKHISAIAFLAIVLFTTQNTFTAQRRTKPISGRNMQKTAASTNISQADQINPQLLSVLNGLTNTVETLQINLKNLAQHVDYLSKQIPSPQLMHAIEGMLSNHEKGIQRLGDIISTKK
jgi:hypothetical protein